MSSRILSGDSRKIAPFQWRSHDKAATDQPEDDHLDLDLKLSVLAAEAEQRVKDAYKKGRQEGLIEGERAGRAQLEPVMKQAAKTVADVSASAVRLRREAEGDVVKLAVAIARRVINRELSLDPDALLGLVKVAFGKVDAREVYRVLAHPEDAPRIEKELAGTPLVKPIPVVADATLARGSVLFETTRGTLDASVNQQLDEIERGLMDRLRRS